MTGGIRWLRVGLLLAMAWGGGCRPPAPGESSFAVMGTYGSVMVGGADRARLADSRAVAVRLLMEIEDALSLHRPQSELSRFNAAAGGIPLRVGNHLRRALELAVRYGELSGGAFDVTVGPLVRRWGFSGGRKPAAAPTADELKRAKALVGYRHIRLEGEGAALVVSNMVVDLGGIAKGYGVDLCCDALLKNGVSNFVVNLAGNMRCYGRPTPERAWRIGVRNPFATGTVVGGVELSGGLAASTSGNYERFVELEGRRYAHIIDPRSGWPVTGMAGVTVVATTAAQADALSTALFVLGLEPGAALAARLPGCAALFIPDKRPIEIWVTSRMAPRFTPEPEFKARVFVIPGS